MTVMGVAERSDRNGPYIHIEGTKSDLICNFKPVHGGLELSALI